MLLATLLTAAAWTTPAALEVPDYGATASGAFGGSAVAGAFEPRALVAKRSGDGLLPFAPVTVAERHETVRAAALAGDGETIVLTLRRHKPTQRIRATFVAPDGTRAATRTISDPAHSATQPELAVAPDGTAVAAWAWHDRSGWRVQAAVRRPGQARFDRPQTVSPPVSRLSRWLWLNVAAGEGGRAALTWHYGGADGLPERALHVRTAGPDGRFGADQELPGKSGFFDVGLAVAPGGAVQLAYTAQYFRLREPPTVLRVSSGVVGAPLSAPEERSRGGSGTSSGRGVVAAFAGDGVPLVAWAKPGDRHEEGGTLEVFAGGAPEVLAQGAKELSLAGGPGGSAVLGWTRESSEATHVATRPQAGGPFGPEVTLAEDGSPSVAMTPAGEAIAVWNGGVAFHPPGVGGSRSHPLVDPPIERGGAPWETMSKLLGAIAATALVAAVAASPASAWTPPTTLSTADEANPVAQAAFDGSVLTRLAEAAAPRCPSASARPRRSPPPTRSRRSGTAGSTRTATRSSSPSASTSRCSGSARSSAAPAARSPTTRTRRRSRRSTSLQTAPRSPPGPGTTRRAGARRSRSAGPASRASTSRRRSPRPLRTGSDRSCASPRARAAAPC